MSDQCHYHDHYQHPALKWILNHNQMRKDQKIPNTANVNNMLTITTSNYYVMFEMTNIGSVLTLAASKIRNLSVYFCVVK